MTTCDNYQRKMLSFDLYKQPFRLLLPDSYNEFRTFAGSLLSICTIMILLIYGGFLVANMLSRDDFKVTLREDEDYYTDIDKLRTIDGFNVAATITGFEDHT